MGLNTRYRTEYSIGLNAVGPDSEHITEYTSYTYILNSLANCSCTQTYLFFSWQRFGKKR